MDAILNWELVGALGEDPIRSFGSWQETISGTNKHLDTWENYNMG